jgi:succinate-semialdehyde dehydrogenase/glutarate-semialdehyde dehydrogenase
MGPGLDETNQVGPLVNDDTASKVDELVRGAVDAGAKAVASGRRPEREGFRSEATVLLDVASDSPILKEDRWRRS